MRNSFDAIRFVFAGIDQPQVAQAKVLHAANDVGDVDEILGMIQNDDHTHPTSSRIPNRVGSCRSPRNHTQPPPPLQTSCPARRIRPGSISLMIRSKRTRAPAWGRTPLGHGIATVAQYPVSVRRQPPRRSSVRASVTLSVVAIARTRRVFSSGTIR